MIPNLRVVTLNLLNDLTDWPLRAALIVAELNALQPDLIALQEVVLPDNTAQWIADQLGGYSLHLTPKTGGRGRHEGLAILSRLPVEAPAGFSFEHQGRVAQRVIVRYAGQPWIFANAHLYWHPIDDRTRRAEVQALIEWLPSPAILCGDFNAEPHYASISRVRQRFQSAYAAANGREPDYTCPTPLYRGPAPRHAARRAALRVAGWLDRRRNEMWRGTVDYIFVDPAIEVRACRLAFDRPAQHNRRIYPSDHFGLMATLQAKNEPRS
jgi:endonuclease/exonuclease/phosphatase family metal-dependent hydrolase